MPGEGRRSGDRLRLAQRFPRILLYWYAPQVHAPASVAYEIEILPVRRPDRVPVHSRIFSDFYRLAAARRNGPDVSASPPGMRLPHKAILCPFGDQLGCVASPVLTIRFFPVTTFTAQIWLVPMNRQPGLVTMPSSSQAISFPSGDQAGL